MTTESAGDRECVRLAINAQMKFTQCHADLLGADLADAAISALRARGVSREAVEKLQADIRCMVEKAADQRLDGYRELGRRAADAENKRDEAHAEIARLRAALEKIATDGGEKWIVRLSREGCVDVAREALNASKGTT